MAEYRPTTEPFTDGPSVPWNGGAAAHTEERSLGELVRELAREGSTLFRQEAELARTEMREKMGVYERNAAAIGIGVVLLVGTLMLLVMAVNRAVTVLLEGAVGVETAVWLAPLIMAAVLGLVGWSALQKGIGAIRREGLTPRMTMDTLREEKRRVERKVKS